jgi:hypothetical protein
MQHRELISTHRPGRSAPDGARRQFNPACLFGIRSSLNAPTDALDLAEYLHEDLGQTLCAVKFQLEYLAQNELPGVALGSSIAALQDAIRQVSSLAEEIRPAPAHRSSLLASVG